MKRKKVFIIAICLAIGTSLVSATVYFQDSCLLILADYERKKTDDVIVTPAEVESAVKQKLSEHVVPVERFIVQEGFLVVLDYITYCDNQIVNTQTEQGGIVGCGFFGKEFEEELIGLQVGNAASFEIAYPLNYDDVVLAGKTFSFDVYIHRTVEYVYPELTDAFVIANYPYVSVSDMYLTIESEIMQEKIREQVMDDKKTYFNNLIEKSVFYIKEEDILVRFEEVVDYYALLASYQGLDVYTYAYQVMNYSEEEFIDYCKSESVHYIKSMLVANRISKRERIELTDEVIEAYCKDNNVYYIGDEPSEYLLNIILVDEVMTYLYNAE